MSESPQSKKWTRTGVVALVAAAFVLGSSVTVLAQDGRESNLADEPTKTTQRQQEPATVDQLDDEQVAELGGEQAAEEALAATAATDGTFNSFRGVYAPRSSQCVMFDTRTTGKLAANSTTTFSLTDPASQGGESGCTVPASAIAAHINLVAIQPAGVGNLKIYGASLTTEPDGGIVNYNQLNPNLNNSNAFVMDNDAAGWKVKVNGSSVHVRGVLMGFFYDGGDSYAAARHDHSITQATGGTTQVNSTSPTTVRSTTLDIQDECSFILVEQHNALVTYSGYVYPYTVGQNTEIDIELWVDGTEETTASLEVEFANTTILPQIPFSKTFLVEDLGSGSHTFAVRAQKENAGSDNADVDADLVVEHRGWDCGLIIGP